MSSVRQYAPNSIEMAWKVVISLPKKAISLQRSYRFLSQARFSNLVLVSLNCQSCLDHFGRKRSRGEQIELIKLGDKKRESAIKLSLLVDKWKRNEAISYVRFQVSNAISLVVDREAEGKLSSVLFFVSVFFNHDS